MKKIHFFNRHLIEAKESYFEHLIFAGSTALWIMATGVILLLHSIFPPILTTTASKNIKKINEKMQKRVEALIARRNTKNKL
jgi:hypothetical protein